LQSQVTGIIIKIKTKQTPVHNLTSEKDPSNRSYRTLSGIGDKTTVSSTNYERCDALYE